jgi:NAD(P)-dependent dehydrogenase (short-subunit alcohol dehydrogenase family)
MRTTIAVLGYPGKTDFLRAELGDPSSPSSFSTTVVISGISISVALLDVDSADPSALQPTLAASSAVLFVFSSADSATLEQVTNLIPIVVPAKLPYLLFPLFPSSAGDQTRIAAIGTDYGIDICHSARLDAAMAKLLTLRYGPFGEFFGKTVVVTGGAQGIGKCVALEFAKRGATVYAGDINEAALAALVAESQSFTDRVHAVVCDVALEADCRRLAGAAAAPIDVLVNDAGIGGFGEANIFADSMDGFDRVIAVNLRGTFMCAKFCSQKMINGGAIVNIASSRAIQSEPKTEGYSASKGGIVALTHAMAMSLGPRGIRVNAISPGWIDVSTWRPGGEQEKLTPEDLSQHPVGRVGVPQDIAEMCLFLASPRAAFITGQNHVIDGGMTKKMIYV